MLTSTFPPIRVLFLIQGEGRGHMTQALALRDMLADAGHEVAAALIGTEPGHEPPSFFVEGIQAPVVTYDSPVFVRDRNRQGIRLGATIGQGLWHNRRYRASLNQIHTEIERLKPDVILNLYDMMGGLYMMRFHPQIPMVAVGHQYLMEHPYFVCPSGWPFNRTLMRCFNRLTSYGARQRWALSYYSLETVPERRLIVFPPLLRQVLFAQPCDLPGEHLQVYLINDGYVPQIEAWHRQHPDVPIHCFCHRPGAPAIDTVDATLTFHQLSGERFLSMMARARGVVCTAGFESTSEALYLGKPVFMVPLARHFEQFSNAFDAVRYGAGLTSSSFDLDRFQTYIDTVAEDREARRRTARYRHWVDAAPERVMRHLESLTPRFQQKRAIVMNTMGSASGAVSGYRSG